MQPRIHGIRSSLIIGVHCKAQRSRRHVYWALNVASPYPRQKTQQHKLTVGQVQFVTLVEAESKNMFRMLGSCGADLVSQQLRGEIGDEKGKPVLSLH